MFGLCEDETVITPPFTDSVREFLRRPAPAVVATIGRHGQPVSAATWYLLQDDDTILMNMTASRARNRHLRADPRIALTVLGDSWYTHISVQGRVVDMHTDADMSVIDRISQHYTGQPFADRNQERVSVIAAIERWYGWNVG